MSKDILKQDLEYIANYDLPYDRIKGKTVLVTGATGLVGVSLIRALKEIAGINILALVRDKEKVVRLFGENSGVNFVVGDIVNPIVIDGDVHYILHCASVTTSKTMVEKPVETLLTSIEGTKNILELAKEKKCESIVYVSSMEMYGNCADIDGEITENKLGYIDPLKVRSNYPESKRLCENMCIAYLSEYGVNVKIARLAQTFGAGILPWENRVFAQFARSVINGTDIVLHTKGLSEGNYCYLADTMTGLFTILLKGENGQAYNISNPEAHTTIADMANMMVEKIAGGKIKVVFDIPEDNKYGYAADTKMKLNSDKLKSLGWKHVVGLQEAYERTISWMMDKL